MSHIDDLLEFYVNNSAVEWRSLDSIASRHKGFSVTAKLINEQKSNKEGILVFGAGSTKAYFSPNLVPENRTVKTECIIVKSRGYIDFEYCSIPCAHKSELWSYTCDSSLISTKFVYYFLKTITESLQRQARATSVKIPQLSVGDTDSLMIPVPPLEVQAEIVRILDSFTELEANLQTELEARRKQYEYYRASLFDSAKLRSTSTELALGELGTWSGGGTPSKSVSSYWTEGYLWVSPKDMKQTYIFQTEDQISEEAVKSRGLRIYPPETILLVARSGILKHSLPVGILEKQATVNQDIKALRVNNSVTSKYALYTLQNYSQDILRKCHKAGGSVDSLDMKKLLAFQIPVPPLAEQERIVGILDKFDALVNDLSSGLPAEIEARRKQYEYYRDQLLTFTPAN